MTRPRLVSSPARSWTSLIPPWRHHSPTTTTALAATSTDTSHPVILRRVRARACGLRGRWRRERAIGSRAMGRIGALVPEVLRTEAQFRLLFAGQVLSLIGDRVMLVALPFAVLEAGGEHRGGRARGGRAARALPRLRARRRRHLRPRRPPARAHRLRRRAARGAGRRRRAARRRRREPADARRPRRALRDAPTRSSSRPSPACCRRPCRTPASCSRPTRCAG